MSLINYSECLIKNFESYPTSYTDIFSSHKKKVFCQLGEDGIIESIFNVIGTTNKYYVEFGGWDGVYLSNTANLRINKGWSGLLLEGDKEKVLSMKNREELNLQNEWVTKDNINQLFDKYNVPQNFDFLSIDIDGDDYYVWKALNYKPRVLVIETNPGISNDIPLTILEGKTNVHKNNYFGANLHAFLDLASTKGYTFLTIDEYNVFFIIDNEFEKFGIEKKTKEEILKTAFVPSKYWHHRNNYTNSPQEWVDLTQTLI
jgi:hypothetical protein